MFYDEAEITVTSGSGGRGCVSFRREKFVPRGGPDGGDGGKGGDVLLEADPSVGSLYEISRSPVFRASNGKPGMGANKTGASAEDLALKVPPGTIVRDAETGKTIADLTEEGRSVVVARGGKGGRGNKAFATAVNQAPTGYEDGEPGRTRKLALELKLIADVGLVGFPNAGKSTLLSRISKARPKVASYPFTTKNPILGIVELPGFRRLVVADLPGLIKNAHAGVGLGDEFLRHIERTRVIIHLIDVAAPDTDGDIRKSHSLIRAELEAYSPELATKPEIVAVSKADTADAKTLKKAVKSLGVMDVGVFSAVTGKGLRKLLETAWRVFENEKNSIDT